jgi:hypothetical protein
MEFQDMSQMFPPMGEVPPDGRPPPINEVPGTIAPVGTNTTGLPQVQQVQHVQEKKFPWLIVVGLLGTAVAAAWYMHSKNMKRNGSDDDDDDDDGDDERDGPFGFGFDDDDDGGPEDDDEDDDEDDFFAPEKADKQPSVRVGKRAASILDDPFFAKGSK